MKLKRILLIIPMLIAIGCIIDSSVTIIIGNYTVRWQHYTALIFLAVVIYCYFKGFKMAVISTGLLLLLGTVNMFSMSADIETTSLHLGPINTPPFNSLALGLLFLFCILNTVTMINLYLDHKALKYKKTH